jgi:glycosyltransferase involved in cell wall biosynthesis
VADEQATRVSTPHVAIDVKNLALYTGGIAAHSRILVAGWLAARPELRFSLVGPSFDSAFLHGLANWRHVPVAWPAWLPRPLRHPYYDNRLFPAAVAKLRPDVMFTPYHDVRLPRPATGVRSVMMVHDTCLQDLPGMYPPRVRLYYLHMLGLNLRRAAHILTLTQASRASVLRHYQVAPERLSVLPTAVTLDFGPENVDPKTVREVQARHGNCRLLFYPSGSDARKNIARLLEAFDLLLADGEDWRLITTGSNDAAWSAHLAKAAPRARDRVEFAGRLEERTVQTYYAAADVVVYPTLCEGFGRLCLEAMRMGTPLACSDIPVLHEVAGGYPEYFDPLDVRAIAGAIRRARDKGRRSPQRDNRYDAEPVVRAFVSLMDAICASA